LTANAIIFDIDATERRTHSGVPIFLHGFSETFNPNR